MASSPKYDTKSLRFLNVGVEEGFLASRYAKLATGVFTGLTLCLVFTLATVVFLMLKGWTDKAYPYIATSQGQQLAKWRSLTLIGTIGAIVIGMLVAKLSNTKYGFGPRGFEVFTSCLVSLLVLAVSLQHPWYLAKVSGMSDPWPHIAEPFEVTDDKLMLLLDVGLTGCHMMLPIRWVMLLPVEVTIILAYAVPAIALGSPMGIENVPVNILLMVLLVGAAAWGKRALEIHERMAFSLIAAERTLRAEAEHRLWQATEAQQEAAGGRSPCEADAASLPTTANTANTGDLFEVPVGDATLESKLEDLVALGFREHWLVKPDALQPLHDRVLGVGGFGITLVAHYHGSEVVLKVPRSSRDKARAKTLLAAAGELRIFRRLHHPNIVFFYGASIDPSSSEIILILEYIQGRELQNAIDGVPRTPHAIVDRCVLADNICSALRYLHAQTPIIIHGDIKGSNVLVEQLASRRNAKLLDFGLSRLLTKRARDVGGTLTWMAPEVIRKESSAKAPSTDVFSFGRLVYLIMTGRCPLSNVSRDTIVEAACCGNCPALEWPRQTPMLEEVRSLCERCAHVVPAERPSTAAAQLELRQWGYAAGLSSSVALALQEAIPQQAHPGMGLDEALEHARNSAQACGQQVSSRRRQRRQRHGGAGAQLVLPDMQETPDASKIMSLAAAMTTWNIRLAASECCSKHALVKELRRLSLELQAQGCRQASFVDDLQCPECKLLSVVDGECQACPYDAGSASKGKRADRKDALASFSEVPDGESDGSGGTCGDAACHADRQLVEL